MKPLFVLMIVFGLTLAITRLATGNWQPTTAGNVAMFVMLCFTSLGHFKFTRGMELMIPKVIPFKKELVYLTGIAEPALGVALLFPSTRYVAGIILILLFMVMLPANIRAALHHVNYETGATDGKGVNYLWFRIPLQVLFIAWIGYFSLEWI